MRRHDRLEVSIGGVAVQKVQKIEVTATDLDTGLEGPTAIVTLSGGAGGARIGDTLVVDASEGLAGAATIFTGEIVGIEPIFDASGKGAAQVRAFNRLHRLTRGTKSRTFENQTDSQIVSAIAKESGLAAAPDIEDDVKYDHVFQHNQTNLEFLRQRASRIGYEVLVDDSTLVFRRRLDVPVLTLGCGGNGDASLKVFHPRLSSASQVSKVTVRGWDPERKPCGLIHVWQDRGTMSDTALLILLSVGSIIHMGGIIILGLLLRESLRITRAVGALVIQEEEKTR